MTEPTLTEVEGDPFEPKGYTLTPVDHDPFEDPSTSTQGKIPPAFIDRIRAGQQLADTVKQQTGDSFESRFNAVYGDPFEAAASRVRRANPTHPGDNMLTLMPQIAKSLLYGATVGPIVAAADLMHQAMGGKFTSDDPENYTKALAAGGLSMFAGTQFGRLRGTPDGAVEHQPIGPLPTAEDFSNAAATIAPPSFTAFHGSLYDFERFDVSKIGTGEGNQTFGHGLYFAENPEVAKSYTRKPFSSEQEEGAKLYQVRIGASTDLFLDVDRPLSEQSEPVKQALRDMKIAPELHSSLDKQSSLSNITEQFVRSTSPEQRKGIIQIEEVMSKAGIRGIKYLDEKSREAGEGTRNFVVFNDRDVQITHQNGRAIAEENLRDLWDDHGIHPAEAAHDAQNDAFLREQLTTPPHEPKDRSGILPVQGSPVPEGTPRTTLARTEDPLIDAILDHPDMRKVINNPVVDDTHTIPNSLGGSEPIDNPTLYRDRDFPKTMTVDGVTFDTADPAAIHENVEEFVIDALTKSGMNQATALKVAFWHFGEVAEDAFYRSHGLDPERVEAQYTDILNEIAARRADDVPPDLFRGTYPDGDPAKAGPGPIDKPTAAEVAKAREMLADYLAKEREGREPTAAGADITRPESLPSLAKEPPPRPGGLVAAGRDAMDKLYGFARNVQAMLDPMSVGSKPAMVIAKDAMNTVRRIRWEHARDDAEAVRRFDLEQQTRMWNAADEESVAVQLGESREHQGLVTLTPEERYFVEYLQGKSQAAWSHARDVGMVEGDGLPAYSPRMVLNVAAASEHAGPQALNELGRNVFTRTAQMLRRKNLMAEETEAAAKELVRKRMEASGATPEEIAAAVEKVQIARNIRSLPLATARLEEAAVWREMINKIQDTGKAAGDDTVAVGFEPGPKWFTIKGNPAFTRWEPLGYDKNPVTGAMEARRDANDNVIMVPKPIYIHPDFKGPLQAILDEGSTVVKAVPGAPSLYGALMTLKGKSMTAILNSPLIHNEVVWSKVAEAAGGREWMGVGLYFRGNRIVDGHPARASELIERGLNPIGPRGSIQDITAIMEEPNQAPGRRSWTAKVLSAVPELFDPAAGNVVRRAIDKAGDFWHNTLLWDRVRDLQFGLADHLSDRLVAKGSDRLTADRVAAHFSNIIVGSIPKEAMSAGAQAAANMLLFSRSFTLGNLSTFKQAAMGLPKPILAQIERDYGLTMPGASEEELAAAQARVAQDAKSIARRKAVATIGMSAALYYVGNALLQHAFNIAANDSTVEEELQGYARRYDGLMKSAAQDPFELRHLLGRLSPTYDNEPKKGDRVHIGYDRDGTAIYGRNPTGKFGEEMIGYPTMPMEMVKRKLSPLAGGILDVLENDKGFGRKIYDENDTTIGGDAKNAFAVAKHLVMRHMPEGQINAAIDLMRDQGDAFTNKLRVFGPMAGFTASVGAPGGMARGEQLSAKSAFDARFNLAWPDIKKKAQSGDQEGARADLTQLGVPTKMQNGLLRNALNPAGALKGRTLRDFYQYSTPEQRDRMERLQ